MRSHTWDLRTNGASILGATYRMAYPSGEGGFAITPLYEAMREAADDWRLVKTLQKRGHGALVDELYKTTSTLRLAADFDEIYRSHKDEIALHLENGYLTVSAAKALDKDHTDRKGKLIRQERYAGSLQRSFYVGDSLTAEEIKAKYENGVLKLEVPKQEARKLPERKTIQIEG